MAEKVSCPAGATIYPVVSGFRRMRMQVYGFTDPVSLITD